MNYAKLILTLGLAFLGALSVVAQPKGYLSLQAGPNLPFQQIDYGPLNIGTALSSPLTINRYFDFKYQYQLSPAWGLSFAIGSRQISQGVSNPRGAGVIGSSTLGYNQTMGLVGGSYTYPFSNRFGASLSFQSGIQITPPLLNDDKAFYADDELIFIDGTRATYRVPHYSPNWGIGVPLVGDLEFFYQFPAGHKLGLHAGAGYGLRELHRLEAEYFTLHVPGQPDQEIDFALVTRGSYSSVGVSFAYALGKYEGEARERRRILTPAQEADYQEVVRSRALMGPSLGTYVGTIYPQLNFSGEATNYLTAYSLVNPTLGLRLVVPLSTHVTGQFMVEQQRMDAVLEVPNPAVDTIGSRAFQGVQAIARKVALGFGTSLFDRKAGKVLNPSLNLLIGFYPTRNTPFPFHGDTYTLDGAYEVTSFDRNVDGASTFFTGGLSLDCYLGTWAVLNLSAEYTYLPEPLFQRRLEVVPLDGGPVANGTYALNPQGLSIRMGIQFPLNRYGYTKKKYLKEWEASQALGIPVIR